MLKINNDLNPGQVMAILARGKWIIAAFGIFSALIAGIASFFIMPEKYEASATVMLNSSAGETASATEDDRLESLLDSLALSPRLNIETCREQITNPRLLQKVIEQLELSGEKYTVQALQTRIKSKTIANTSLIKITVTDEKPSRATAIANSLAGNLVTFINDSNRQHLNNSVQFLEEQINEQEEELAGAVDQYQEFLSRPEGVEELQSELDTKLQLLTQFQKQLVENEVETATTRSALSQVEETLAQTPQTLKTRKAMPLFTFRTGESESGDTVKTSPSTVPSEEINPVYIELAQKKAGLQEKLARLHTGQAQINDKISSIKPELERLQSKLAEKKVDQERLNNKVETLQSNYNMLTRKYQETKMNASAQAGEANIMITSKAQEPRQPVAPRKMLNIALAGILGLIAGIFFVFMQELLKHGYSESNGN